jgi:hypothetical protein
LIREGLGCVKGRGGGVVDMCSAVSRNVERCGGVVCCDMRKEGASKLVESWDEVYSSSYAVIRPWVK